MKRFIWDSEAYSIDGGMIDRHHQELMSMVNALMDLAEQENPDKTKYLQLMIKLDGYIQKHFKLEEGLMHARGFPHLDEHMKSHILLADKASELIVSPNFKQIKQVAEFLRGWLEHHVLQEDMKFKPYFHTAPD